MRRTLEESRCRDERSPENISEAIQILEEREEAIRQAGFRRARKNHTWEMRFERVFRLMNLINTWGLNDVP